MVLFGGENSEEKYGKNNEENFLNFIFTEEYQAEEDLHLQA